MLLNNYSSRWRAVWHIANMRIATTRDVSCGVCSKIQGEVVERIDDDISETKIHVQSGQVSEGKGEIRGSTGRRIAFGTGCRGLLVKRAIWNFSALRHFLFLQQAELLKYFQNMQGDRGLIIKIFIALMFFVVVFTWFMWHVTCDIWAQGKTKQHISGCYTLHGELYRASKNIN